MRNTNLKVKLGRRIKELRKIRNYSQEQLAEKLGIAQNTLSKIETGENFLTSDTLENIANVLNISLSELFDFEHLDTPQNLADEIHSYIEHIKNDNSKLVILYKIIQAMAKD